MANDVLNILGCYPEGLEILFDLKHEGEDFKSYYIYKNLKSNDRLDPFYLPNRQVVVHDVEVEKSNAMSRLIKTYPLVFGVVGVWNKPDVFDYFVKNYGINKNQFINLFHPSSVISLSSILAKGIQVEALSTISTFSKIGFGVTIKRNCSIGHHCNIKEYVTLNPGVIISSKVTIEKNTMLGTGSVVEDGIHIGANTIIGIGSVVVKDIPSNVVAFGNPCKIIRKNKIPNDPRLSPISICSST